MAWAYDGTDFEYDDWSPYAVFEDDGVLVVKSEGDYFFAINTDPAGERWQPLPIEADGPEDLERLRFVAARLLDVETRYREQLGAVGPADADRPPLVIEDDRFRVDYHRETSSDLQPTGRYELYVRDGADWLIVEDYDTLWGVTQGIMDNLLHLLEEHGGDSDEQ